MSPWRRLWDPDELLLGQEQFVRRQREKGEPGEAWLRRLPGLIAQYEERWELRTERPFPELSFNFVAPCTRADGSPAVLKLSCDGEVRVEELDALRIFDGRGACRVLEVDEPGGCFLLERILPGTELRTLADDETATRIAAGVMQRLWRPVPAVHRLETLEQRGRALERLRAQFDGGTGPFASHLVERAEEVFRDFPQGVTPMALHGDCHHYNIVLARDRTVAGVGSVGSAVFAGTDTSARPSSGVAMGSGDEWITIDPHGVAGDPGYEVGCFIYNPGGHLDPLEQPDPRRFIERRVAVLAESLGWERERILGWCIAQSVLSAWWTYEDEARADLATMTVAEHLVNLGT